MTSFYDVESNQGLLSQFSWYRQLIRSVLYLERTCVFPRIELFQTPFLKCLPWQRPAPFKTTSGAVSTNSSLGVANFNKQKIENKKIILKMWFLFSLSAIYTGGKISKLIFKKLFDRSAFQLFYLSGKKFDSGLDFTTSCSLAPLAVSVEIGYRMRRWKKGVKYKFCNFLRGEKLA